MRLPFRTSAGPKNFAALLPLPFVCSIGLTPKKVLRPMRPCHIFVHQYSLVGVQDTLGICAVSLGSFFRLRDGLHAGG